MNKEMFAICEWAIKAAKKSGADDCKASVSKQRFVEIRYREKKPEIIKEALTQGLSISLYVNKRYSSQSTSDLREGALNEFISNAVSNTKLLEEDPYRYLPDPKYYEGRADVDLQIVDPTYEQFTAEQRHALTKAIENACLKRGGDKVISVEAAEYDQTSEQAVMTSNGFEGYNKNTIFYAGASMTVQDEGDRKPEGYHYVGYRMRKEFPAPEEIGITAAERTLDLLGAKKIETETLPIIVENQSVSNILGGLISAFNGGNIQQKRSFLADKLGKKIGSEKLTMIDDPFILGGFGSRLYDGDGFAAKKRTIMESGVVKEFLVDWYYSRKLGWEPTTGGTSNLILPPGTRSVKEIMKDLGRGIYITGFLGGNSNSTTGDFSIGINGHLFDNGVPVQAIAEMNIADNHLEFWNKLVEAANDPWKYSNWRMPSLVFDKVVVAGV